MKSILDPSFKYVPAAATDIRKTFARVRREQAAAKRKEETQFRSPVLIEFFESQRGPARVFRYKARQ